MCMWCAFCVRGDGGQVGICVRTWFVWGRGGSAGGVNHECLLNPKTTNPALSEVELREPDNWLATTAKIGS